MKNDITKTNVFAAAAEALWNQGEDGEVIARDLALAFDWIVTKGKGPGNSTIELQRFLSK